MTNERTYVDLIFRATQKYASWDPEIAVKVGDWGRITKGPRGLFWRKNGTFVREGNIYSDGKADKYGIYRSQEVDVSACAGGIHPVLAKCTMKGAFKFSSGRGAILAMENAMITLVDPPGALKYLLDDPNMRGVVVVSEVHSCSSYARVITAEAGGIVALGLRAEPPISGIGSVAATATWVRNVASGNFKSQVNKMGERSFYPLFRLVSFSEEETSTGIGGNR
ncbi:hypothetical protein B0H13DRAFT_2486459 [Mycena leptocephala]|nr:hypothetical protein B0H13DRAFT_2486459 [Mycena leptocephala]